MGPESRGGPRRLRLVTWNVGQIYLPFHQSQLADEDVAHVAAILNQLDPDLALLQELRDEHQLARLRAETSLSRGTLAEHCRYDRHVAILAREALEPRFEQHVLEPSGRGLVLARLSIDGIAGAALSLHFDILSRSRRRQQAEAVRRLLDERTEPLVIVGGDLNLDPEWAEQLSDPVDSGTHRLLRGSLMDVGRHAGPTLMGLLRVDHVLAGGPALRSSRVAVSPKRLPVGDHFPVVCELLVVQGGTFRSAS
jgi:endonuclease/exonuclease/phosphatase family metal-dependent hydrolase